MNTRISFKILGQRPARDVLNLKARQPFPRQFEAAVVGGKNEDAVRFQQRRGVPDQFLLVTLDVERI
ncbi:MAG: hypothetical protein AAB134_01125, partial [Pseudomonadota bacterium]